MPCERPVIQYRRRWRPGAESSSAGPRGGRGPGVAGVGDEAAEVPHVVVELRHDGLQVLVGKAVGADGDRCGGGGGRRGEGAG